MFMSVQGGGRRRCGGIVDWRQRSNGMDSERLLLDY